MEKDRDVGSIGQNFNENIMSHEIGIFIECSSALFTCLQDQLKVAK
jgi:hypothetical protein